MTAEHRRLLSPLGVRLAAAFVVVAVAGVSVLGILSLVAARGEVSGLVADIHRDDARSAAAAAGNAYEEAGGWGSADLAGAAAIAARGQATLAVADDDGEVVAAPADEAAEMMASMHGVEILDVDRDDPVTAPVLVDGARVGTVALRFPSSHLPTPERQARDALARTTLLGGALAVAVAVAVAVFVARRVTAPVTALTRAATAVEAGERGVRVQHQDAPGELGTLVRAFDRMAAALEREDRLRRQLVADVAHEVRTPLTILRGTTEGLVDGVLPADPATMASLHEEVLRLTRLVGDLDTLAAADAAGLRLERVAVDLAVIAAGAVEATASLAAERGIDVDLQLQPAPAVGDAGRLHQVLVNLLVNAIRYTPADGQVRVESAWGDGTAGVTVVDSGPGLSDDDLAHVFDRFYRGSAAGTSPGSGVGLAIAAELARAHGGELTATNAPGGGASFTLALPAGP